MHNDEDVGNVSAMTKVEGDVYEVGVSFSLKTAEASLDKSEIIEPICEGGRTMPTDFSAMKNDGFSYSYESIFPNIILRK